MKILQLAIEDNLSVLTKDKLQIAISYAVSFVMVFNSGTGPRLSIGTHFDPTSHELHLTVTYEQAASVFFIKTFK